MTIFHVVGGVAVAVFIGSVAAIPAYLITRFVLSRRGAR